MKGIRPVRIVVEGLQKFALPTLSRPPVKPSEDPTAELVNWGIRYHVCSVIAHVRTILKGLVQLCDAGNIPAAWVISRHVFEWAAHACYVSRNLRDYHERKQWREAWKLLSAAATGNLWMKRYGATYGASGVRRSPVLDDVSDPIHISKAISAYEQHLEKTPRKGDARDSYSLLSEHFTPKLGLPAAIPCI